VDAGVLGQNLEIEADEGGVLIGYDERPKWATNGLASRFVGVRSR
jgi:hypothetical protein